MAKLPVPPVDVTAARAASWHRKVAATALLLLTVLTAVVVGVRVRLDPNVASLLPARGEATALRRYLHAFGGTDLAIVLVQGQAAERVAAAAESVAVALRGRSTVRAAAAGLEPKTAPEPMLLWRHADGEARQALAQALRPEAMRARLRESRAMLLAPGGGAATETITRDPLRLGQLLADRGALRTGATVQPTGAFASDDGLAQLVLVRPAGEALRGSDARAFVADAREVIARAAGQFPDLRFGLTGGHAIAEATERMLVRDLALSGTLALVLAALAFAVCFPRLRALLAVLPPLGLGTLWTAGIAALWPAGLSAIAVAFTSVVVGVGVDTGVHVYDALLAARRAGVEPAEAARIARRETARPTLVAAATGAVAFSSLALSDIEALGQLGLLCAGGELLTAVAILVVTPEIGARLERGRAPRMHAGWTRWASWLTASRPRAALLAALAMAPVVAVACGGAPTLSESIVAVRPKGLEPLRVQQRVYDAFGGKPGQWVVLFSGPDGEQVRARADRVAERLATMSGDVETVDALTALVPAAATQQARLAERDALDLGSKAAELELALREVGFAPERFEGVLMAMRSAPHELLDLGAVSRGPAGVLVSRYLAADAGEQVVALYVQPRDDEASRARIAAAVKEVDADAQLTGYGRLEQTLRASLRHDLPRISLVAGLLVLLALGVSLRRPLDVALAALVVVCELGAVLLAIRLLGVPLHAYDALVLPVLLGITVDEGTFLLHRVRRAPSGDGAGPVAAGLDPVAVALEAEGPPIAATALTTAAGFGALALCDFDGLRDLGMVGALGSITGLLVALVIVPAGLRLVRRRVPAAPHRGGSS